MTFDGENALSYTYDNLGRIATRTTGSLSSTYSYVGGGYGAGSTTPLVSSIQQTGISFSYTYDNRGNITSETRNGATTTYAYDALGQLIRVNDPHENATWVYNYDRGGNITSKVKYAFTTADLGAAIETIPYAYGDANWKDKLTAYNGTTITYDAIGNPLNDGTWTYAWSAGRQLTQMVKDGMTIQYKYDHNGLRVAKIVNGVETRYVLNGKQLTHLNRGNDWMHFFYDAQGRPAKVRYNGTIYSYIHNLQGDVVGIIDTDGNVVVEYKYDAWGKALFTTGSLAGTLGNLNPFRYRGYVYDEETRMYWLKSRYYYPELQRFINADAFVSDDLTVKRVNLYEYCFGNPVSYVDYDGCEGTHTVTLLIYVFTGDRTQVTNPALIPLVMFGHAEIMFEYGDASYIMSYGPDQSGISGEELVREARIGTLDGKITVFPDEQARIEEWEGMGFSKYEFPVFVSDEKYQSILTIAYCVGGHVNPKKKRSKTVKDVFACENDHLGYEIDDWTKKLMKAHVKYDLLQSTCFTFAMAMVGKWSELMIEKVPKGYWMRNR